MNKPNDGGGAFPRNVEGHYFMGMTLRDYFAAQALQSIGIPARFNSASEWTLDTNFAFAKLAYEIADAMLKAREQ